jgi:hypothetical protein
MMTRAEKKHIVISAETFEAIRDLAAPGETPETVLRRVLGLPPREQGRKSPVLKPYEKEEE